jgi:outer membrane protein assembly factor BamB
MDRRTFLTTMMVVPVVAQRAGVAPRTPAPSPAAPRGAAWTQWGGPNRNFTADAAGLKDTWPAGGPRVVWKRVLGEGYSAPSVENGVLYTIYGRPREEVVIAADAETGKTLWERPNPMTFTSDAAQEQGNGPYSAPLVVGDRLFTTGVAGRLQCLNKKTGQVVWTQELVADLHGSRMMYGYASSPIAYRDFVIVPVGGPGRGLMAFNQADGKVVWSKIDFGNVYSSPVLINVAGLDEVVALLDGAMVGANPLNGDPQWQVPFKADYSIAVSTPLWGEQNTLFVSAEYNAGAKVVQLARDGDRTRATELWSSNRLRLHHGNAMLIDGVLYFSSGGKGSQAILSAVDAQTGKIYWQQRSIQKATFVWADQKLVTLDEDGTLMIAHPSRDGFRISATAPLLSRLSWTPPVLVGTRLYILDRREMMSVDLG